jgi:peroxiredoxin
MKNSGSTALEKRKETNMQVNILFPKKSVAVGWKCSTDFILTSSLGDRFMLQKSIVLLVIFGVLGLNVVNFSVATEDEEPLPKFSLPVPDNVDFREYLGLTDKAGKTFTIGDIDADVVLIELFSTYCPYCQREAPNVNTLCEDMEALPLDTPKVRILGIGASNSEFEINHFRNTYHIAFPLFPDKDMRIYKALQGAGTPGFIGVRLEKGKTPVIVLRASGGFGDAGDFIQDLLQEAGF